MEDAQAPKFDQHSYWKTRGYKTSARLHLQHWLFESTIGFSLHPTILRSVGEHGDSGLKVADLGCGNGIWLSTVSAQLPPSSALTGFDINASLFPAPPFLAPNVTLLSKNILTELTDPSLLGTFDVVHIRAFTSIIFNNDTSGLLGAAMALLKPGGWLQWEESRSDLMRAVSPGESVSKATCDMMVGIMEQGARRNNLLYDFLSSLPDHLKRAGFTSAAESHFKLRPEHMQAWTEDYLQVWEDITSMLPTAADKPDTPLTREVYSNLLAKCLDETEKGVVLETEEIVLVIGQKSS